MFLTLGDKLKKFNRISIITITITTLISVVLACYIIHYGRNNALTVKCYSNLKFLLFALNCYAQEKHCLPPAAIVDNKGQKLHSWRVLILPYLDEECIELYKQYSFDEPWNGPNNRKLFDKCPDYFRCPINASDKRTTNYLAVVGPGTLWTDNENKLVANVKRILLLENQSKKICWLDPEDFNPDEAKEIIQDKTNRINLLDRHYSYCNWQNVSDLSKINEWEYGKPPIITESAISDQNGPNTTNVGD
jgi:hypothetical protein